MNRQCRLADQRGSTLMVGVFAIIAMLAIVGAVFNFGFLSYNKTQLQNSADAAALAGVRVLVANPARNQNSAATTAAAMAALAPGKTSDSVTTKVAPDGSSIIVTTSRTVRGVLMNRTVSAVATARIVAAGGINQAPNIVIPYQNITNWNQQYTMRMANPASQYYSKEMDIPNAFDYCDIVFTSDYKTANSTYIDLCKNGDPNLCTPDTTLYYWAHSSAEQLSIQATDSRLDTSNAAADASHVKRSVYNEETQQYEPPIQPGDKRLMTFPMVDALPDKSTPDYSCKTNDNLKIKGFIGFVIDSYDYGYDAKGNLITETLYHTNGQQYTACPMNTIKGHFIQLNVSGVPVGTGSSIATGVTTIQLVTNDHPENDY